MQTHRYQSRYKNNIFYIAMPLLLHSIRDVHREYTSTTQITHL